LVGDAGLDELVVAWLGPLHSVPFALLANRIHSGLLAVDGHPVDNPGYALLFRHGPSPYSRVPSPGCTRGSYRSGDARARNRSADCGDAPQGLAPLSRRLQGPSRVEARAWQRCGAARGGRVESGGQVVGTAAGLLQQVDRALAPGEVLHLAVE